eukprot:scaffold113399_cov63-Phaeocystis_antarctica.AAC.1
MRARCRAGCVCRAAPPHATSLSIALHSSHNHTHRIKERCHRRYTAAAATTTTRHHRRRRRALLRPSNVGPVSLPAGASQARRPLPPRAVGIGPANAARQGAKSAKGARSEPAPPPPEKQEELEQQLQVAARAVIVPLPPVSSPSIHQ